MSTVITVTVLRTQGSAPRDAGTVMQVFADRIAGTIGGGALEWEAIAIARTMLGSGKMRHNQTFPLGPNLGQCCGGTVVLDFQLGTKEVVPSAPPLWIWGAGHVGRAVMGIIAPFDDREITLVDTEAARMPKALPAGVTPLVASDPIRVVDHAHPTADHLIMTYSHNIDLGLCDALLRCQFGSIGLIGSATKWARFQKRLATLGHAPEQIARIACPIGNPALGKHPQAIAIGVATALISGFDRARDKGTG